MQEELKELMKALRDSAINGITEKWATTAAMFIEMNTIKEGTPEHDKIEMICFEAAKAEIKNLLETNDKLKQVFKGMLANKIRESGEVAVH